MPVIAFELYLSLVLMTFLRRRDIYRAVSATDFGVSSIPFSHSLRQAKYTEDLYTLISITLTSVVVGIIGHFKYIVRDLLLERADKPRKNGKKIFLTIECIDRKTT